MNLRYAMTPLAACLVVVYANAGAAPAHAQDADLKANFTTLLPAMGAEKGFEQPQQKWQELCWQAAAPGHEAERREACRLMAGALDDKTAPRARVWLLKQLERIGRGESVAAVAAVVYDSDPLVRDAAVRALANNPDAAAGEALRGAMKAAADSPSSVALINALGFRREAASVPILGGLLGRPGAAAEAAARALGKIATPEAAAALKAALTASQGESRLQIGDALARCGDRLLEQGKSDDAAAIAQALLAGGDTARLAGLELLLRARSDQAPKAILKVLSSGQPLETSVAVGYVAQLESPGIRELADGLADLPPPAQVALLQAFGARRDGVARPAVVKAATSADPAVQLAALGALGGVGDASTVPLLIKAIEQGGDPAAAARRSLETTFAAGIDRTLVETMKATDDAGRRALFIEILDRRRASSAAPALLAEVLNSDANVRRRAMTALGNVASAAEVGGMIRGLLNTSDGGERDEAERAIAAVCGRVAEEARRAEPVLNVYRSASGHDQIALLTVLGRVGGSNALGLVREAVASPDAVRQAAGRQALFHWPDSAVAADLATLAETSPDADLKIRAIQALGRSVTLQGALSNDEKLALLVRGMKQASRDEERRMLIDRAREAHTFAAVKFAAESLDNPKLSGQACATIVDLLHRDELRNPNQAEANAILDRVIATSKDKSLVERARSFQKAK